MSTEYGAARGDQSLDILALRAEHPQFASFLEVGVETLKGLDEDTLRWIQEKGPTTYHFLDINLDEPEDFDETWLRQVGDIQQAMSPAWMCGDAGLWHVGGRERGHMLLLPPILSTESAMEMAAGVIRLQRETGLEIFPENPPGSVYLGDLHLLDFFSKVISEADTGMLLDCAHLAIYQRLMGHDPLDALDRFPLERIIEIHVAGASEGEVDGYAYVEDDHTVEVLPETWTILEHIAKRAPNLKAVVFECERNPLSACLPGFTRIADILREAPMGKALSAAGRPL